MIFEVTDFEVASLSDEQLRGLIGRLCERELRTFGHPASAATWGGDQCAADGGVDARVSLLNIELPADAKVIGYIPRPVTCFQVRAMDMPRSEVLKEMAPGGDLRPSIARLASQSGAYIIVSSRGSLADGPFQDRLNAMTAAASGHPMCSALTLDFYARRRIATWVNQHVGLVAWVHSTLCQSRSGWRPFHDWSSSPASADAAYLLDPMARLFGLSIAPDGLGAVDALEMVRGILTQPKGAVRLGGLSGVGKTRFIQALFDDRIGHRALLKSDALYTDMADGPDPSPQDMLSCLIEMKHQAVMIVDNCDSGLHRKLVGQMLNSSAPISLITVEYDVNDDQLESTETFRLGPSSEDLIERMLEARYLAIAPPSRRVIAGFAEGNARVAFALADTAVHGDTLTGLNDTQLVERLFDQQKSSSDDLLDAAKACALVYSFDGEADEGEHAEMAILAALVRQTAEQLHKHVAELHRRQLIQKRGRWRALLPHALANRLAKQALDDIPRQRLSQALSGDFPPRLRRSLSRRLGYLHGVSTAEELARQWLKEQDLPGAIGMLHSVREQIFRCIAPVHPNSALDYIERAAGNQGERFFTDDNLGRSTIVSILGDLAYEAALFQRSAVLLARFAKANPMDGANAAFQRLRSLCWGCLSGTHASAAQRVAVVRPLLEGTEPERSLGIELLSELLRTSAFNPNRSFEFGAWKRDFGVRLADRESIIAWFAPIIELVRDFGNGRGDLSKCVRQVAAEHLLGLCLAGLVDDVVALADEWSKPEGWPEGWNAIQKVLSRGAARLSASQLKSLQDLERRLRPSDLAGEIRSHVLVAGFSALDIADIDIQDGEARLRALERHLEACVELGRQFAAVDPWPDELIAEIIRSDSDRISHFGQGLALGSGSLTATWDRILGEFLKASEASRRSDLLTGFVRTARQSCSSDVDKLLDRFEDDDRLHPHFVACQVAAGWDERAFVRLMKAVAWETCPIASFGWFALRPILADLTDAQVQQLVSAMLRRERGSAPASDVLEGRVLGGQTDQSDVSEGLKSTGREFLRLADLPCNEQYDRSMGRIVEASLHAPDHDADARALCLRIRMSIRNLTTDAWKTAETVSALARKFPIIVLDLLLEQADVLAHHRPTPNFYLTSERAPPADAVPEAAWFDWVTQGPVTRFELAAQVMPFMESHPDGKSKGWTAVAMRLIELAPEPVSVLDVFLKRFEPMEWTGSRVAAFEAHAPLIASLMNHANREVARWANSTEPTLLDRVDVMREYEQRNEQSFE